MHGNDVKQGLRKARPWFPPGRGARDDDTTLSLIAETVVEHLKLCRWQLGRLPSVAPHCIGSREGDESYGPTCPAMEYREVVGWAATVDGRAIPDLLQTVRHFRPDETDSRP